MDKDKKSLSPRAQKLLDEIVQENSSVHETPKSEIGKDIFKEVNKETNATLPKTTQKLFAKHANFSPALYRSLTQNDKKPFWFLIFAILIMFISSILFKSFSYLNFRSSSNEAYASKISVIKKDIMNLDTKITQLTQEKNQEANKVSIALKSFPNKIQTQNIVDDITRLFEMSNLMIIKQDIKIQKKQSEIIEALIPFSTPNPEVSLFVKENVKSEIPISASPKKLPATSSETALNNLISSGNVNADKIKSNNLKEDKKDMQTTDIFGALNAGPPPAEISGIEYLTIQLSLRGGYFNYMKARSALTRVIPSVNIPLEEIFSNQNKSMMEFRVIYDIPMREEN